jgi:hypothetical protein
MLLAVIIGIAEKQKRTELSKARKLFSISIWEFQI